MIEKQQIENIHFNVIHTNQWNGYEFKDRDILGGTVLVKVTRKDATKVLGKDVSFTETVEVDIRTLPKEIQDELIAIFSKIEALL